MTGLRKSLCRVAGVIALSAALWPVDASAQLRGLGGAIPNLGSITPSPPLLPIPPAAPTNGLGDNSGIVLPGANLPTALPPQQIDTITNTLTGGVISPGSGVGSTLNALRQRAARLRTGRLRSRVPPPNEHRFVAHEVLIGLSSRLPLRVVDALARPLGLVRLELETVGLTGTTFYRLRISDGRSVADVVRALEADGAVSMAQPNYRLTLQQTQVAHRSLREPDFGYAALTLRLPEAHKLATGRSVLVAVIDGRVDTAHPELAGSSIETINATDVADTSDEGTRHGTAMVGTLIAHMQLMGVAPAARILAIRAFAGNGTTSESTTMAILKAIDLAVAHHARVINMSFAGPNDPEIARTLAAANRRGVVLIAAAGNAGPKSAPLYPAADPHVIAVTATDFENHLFARANRGRYIALAAPGVDVLSPAPDDSYELTTGTSIATAEVSGVAALLLGINPSLTPKAVRDILMSSAKHLGTAGRNAEFGAGLTDAYRAVLSLTASPPSPNVSAAR